MYFTDEPPPGMSAPVNSKRQNPRRQDILEATLRVIGESGVNSVTHRAVAEEADVALASTTYYFDSKSALVEEALELMIARSTEYVRLYTACPPRITHEELVDRVVGFVDAHANDPNAFLLAQWELMLEAGREEYLRPLARRWTIAYMDGFHHVVRSAGLPEPAAEVIANFVAGAVLNHVTTPSDDFLEAHFKPLLTTLVSALESGLPRES
jgi:TetR/AcrR family transcriptional regulator, regulator of biofilm formation and stress response